MVVPLVILALLLAFPAGAMAGNETWTTPPLNERPEGKQLTLKQVLAMGEATRTVKEYRQKYENIRALGYLDTATGNWLIR